MFYNNALLVSVGEELAGRGPARKRGIALFRSMRWAKGTTHLLRADGHTFALQVLSMFAAIFYEEYNVAVYVFVPTRHVTPCSPHITLDSAWLADRCADSSAGWSACVPRVPRGLPAWPRRVRAAPLLDVYVATPRHVTPGCRLTVASWLGRALTRMRRHGRYVLLIWAYENDKTPKPLYIGMVTVAFSVLTDVISHGIEGDKILGSKTNKFANKAEEDLGKFCVVMSVLCTILKLPLLYVMYKEYKIRGGSTMIPGASASANSYSSLDAPGLESS